MAASLKAGHSFRQGVQSVVEEGAEPAASEFKRVLTENKVSNYELTVRGQSGEETVVSYNAATFHNRDR